MDEDQLRNIAADQMAQGFILEILLSRYFKSHPEEMWDDLGKLMVAGAKRTDHFTNVVKTDAEAEVFADVVVKMHQSIQTYVDRGLGRARASVQAT